MTDASKNRAFWVGRLVVAGLLLLFVLTIAMAAVWVVDSIRVMNAMEGVCENLEISCQGNDQLFTVLGRAFPPDMSRETFDAKVARVPGLMAESQPPLKSDCPTGLMLLMRVETETIGYPRGVLGLTADEVEMYVCFHHGKLYQSWTSDPY